MGERVAIARTARSMTQIQLAGLAGVGVSTVASIERGHEGVSIGNVLKVLCALDLMHQAAALFDPATDHEVIRFATETLSQRRRV